MLSELHGTLYHQYSAEPKTKPFASGALTRFSTHTPHTGINKPDSHPSPLLGLGQPATFSSNQKNIEIAN
jgi:hypothetical protein